MYLHPEITAKFAEQRRRDLIAEADAYRLARAAREGRPQRSGHARVHLVAKLACFVNPFTRRGARPLRLRWRRAAIDGG